MSSEKRKGEDGAAGAPSTKRARWDSDGPAPGAPPAANGANGKVLDPQSTRAKIEAAKANLARAREMLANRQKAATVRLTLSTVHCHSACRSAPSQPLAGPCTALHSPGMSGMVTCVIFAHGTAPGILFDRRACPND